MGAPTDHVLTNSARRASEAQDTVTTRPPRAVVHSDMEGRVTGTGVQPRRARGREAREALARDGAVVLPDGGDGPDDLACAAAEMLGQQLRQLFAVRHRGATEGEPLDLHSDSFHVVQDVHGRPLIERDPDEDYLLMLLGRAPAMGGESLIVDAYRLVDRLREERPELHAFLVGTDVDTQGTWTDLPGVPPAPRIGRLVEYTRTGRRIVRLTSGTTPLLRSPGYEQAAGLLVELRDISIAAAATAPPVELQPRDVLVLDNYRCWHGRRSFRGARQLYVQTVRSEDAY